MALNHIRSCNQTIDAHTVCLPGCRKCGIDPMFHQPMVRRFGSNT